MSMTGLRTGAVALRTRAPWRPAMLVWQAPAAAALVALAAAVHGPVPALVGVACLAAVTPELVRVDVAEHRLPDALTLPACAAGLVGVALAGAAGQPMLPALLAGAGVLALFLVLAVAGGMGLGDVKLAGALGVVLGLLGAASVILFLVVAFLAGGVGALLVLARSGRRARLPFGPFLLAGFWVALLASA
ncbi:A24 family peptidase [Naasia sp. SYSU D00057]|uniref:prepilin peptidase n=1 Tax=Naasia sp. SYSU D00057 TaxID=2817380 RepID=UPI001B312F52|nr:A24 family peptidase [Naasia sp. SYSU D00057]